MPRETKRRVPTFTPDRCFLRRRDPRATATHGPHTTRSWPRRALPATLPVTAPRVRSVGDTRYSKDDHTVLGNSRATPWLVTLPSARCVSTSYPDPLHVHCTIESHCPVSPPASSKPRIPPHAKLLVSTPTISNPQLTECRLASFIEQALRSPQIPGPRSGLRGKMRSLLIEHGAPTRLGQGPAPNAQVEAFRIARLATRQVADELLVGQESTS